MSRNKSFIISIIISLVFAIAPFVFILVYSGWHYPKMPVETMSDNLYYYARAVDITRGHVFIGNPYIKENKDEVSPAFFVADWFWAVPLLLGFSLQTSIIINQIFWFLVFGIFLYYLFKFFEVEEKYIPWAVALAIFIVYWYLARPVAMQVVYPVYMVWLVSFVSYLKKPQSKKYIILLGLSTTLSVYIYTYLAQIIFAIFCVLLFASFFLPFKHYRSLWFSSIMAFFLSIPFLLYTWKQIHHPLYFETMTRIGLINTHVIGTPAVFYSSVVLLSLVIVYFSRTTYSKTELLLISISSLGFLITLLSNIITGKDLELAIHIGRFTDLWSTVMLVVFLQKIHTAKIAGMPEKSISKFIILGLYAILVLFSLVLHIRIWSRVKNNLPGNDVYTAPIAWLVSNTPKQSVIFADTPLSALIPVETDDYVLFHQSAVLQIDSDFALQNRYLASRLFSGLSLQILLSDMPLYAGNGNSNHEYMTYNRDIKYCKMVHLVFWSKTCDQFQTLYSFTGQKYFSDMQERYDLFKKTPLQVLRDYNVSYIVFDKQNDKWAIPKGLKSVWSDDRFEIFQL
jgi:hypothetical protein